jgi:hypothetical protein
MTNETRANVIVTVAILLLGGMSLWQTWQARQANARFEKCVGVGEEGLTTLRRCTAVLKDCTDALPKPTVQLAPHIDDGVVGASVDDGPDYKTVLTLSPGPSREQERLYNYEPKVRWIGWIVYAKPYSGIDPGFYSGRPPDDILLDNSIEIGMRDDGVLVWRKTKEGAATR